jgi:DEAD/DEAH box helicase domain-containing protein
VLVATSAPLDQFIIRNPSYFFDRSPEHALIDPDNLHILVNHVKCAAFELPFEGSEAFGVHDLPAILGVLAEQGLVHRADGGASIQAGDQQGLSAARWTWTSESYPADAVSLRSVSSDNFVVVDDSDQARVIGETDFSSGTATLHPKAIYIVEGKLYQVERLDFGGRKAFVQPVDCDYYTNAITYTRVSILEAFARASLGNGDEASYPLFSHGEVHVVTRVVGFKKVKFYTNENVGSGELDLPEQQMHTTSCWLTVPPPLMKSLAFAPDERRDGVVGLAFAMQQVAQLLLMCDRHDIGISIDAEGNLGDPPAARHDDPMADQAGGFSVRIFVYDNYPGGIGFSEPLFRMRGELLENTRRLIAECECENGCPGCVGPVGNTGPSAKAAALAILDQLLVAALEG